ncbi:MAG: hypothetical protein H6765_00755 [Candidatus Peribacteria bacterium]|nr:MAG: hypothetical protein H6765_00755 [Candidatus Peribacteria bacterium]
MKRFLKITGIVLVSILLLLAIYGLTVYKGIFPVPGFVSSMLVDTKGLTDSEQAAVKKISNLPFVLLNSPDGDKAQELLLMLQNGADQQVLESFITENVDGLHDETVIDVAETLGMNTQEQNYLLLTLDEFRTNGSLSEQTLLKLDSLRSNHGLTDAVLQRLGSVGASY